MMNNNCSRDEMLTRINEHSFAVNDLHLYLDSHPDDRTALQQMQKHLEIRKELLKEYAKRFGPLTIDTTDYADGSSWQWVTQPWPWEPKGGCR